MKNSIVLYATLVLFLQLTAKSAARDASSLEAREGSALSAETDAEVGHALLVGETEPLSEQSDSEELSDDEDTAENTVDDSSSNDAFTGDESTADTNAARSALGGQGTSATSTPYAFSPHVSNWWYSFDRIGWGSVPHNTWMTGLWRNSCNKLYCLEMTYYSTPQKGGWGHAIQANWWHSFDRKGWSTCPHGYALTGLYRNSCNELYCLEYGMCRKPSTGPGFTSCYTHNVWHSFDHKGPSACKPGYYLAGFWRNSCNKLYCIEYFKCCTQPVSRHAQKQWRDVELQCTTRQGHSNHAGIVRVHPPSGYTMVSGGINNLYRHFNRLSVFEESMPEQNHWRCDTGLGAGRLKCSVRACRLPHGASCVTKSQYTYRAGVLRVGVPGGYTMMGGGMYNHYRKFNPLSVMEEMMPEDNHYRCDAGLGPGRITCYSRGCKVPSDYRLLCETRPVDKYGHGFAHAMCRSGYTMVGGGIYNSFRHFNPRSAFEESFPYKNGWRCDMGFGLGTFRCFARCCKLQRYS